VKEVNNRGRTHYTSFLPFEEEGNSKPDSRLRRAVLMNIQVSRIATSFRPVNTGFPETRIYTCSVRKTTTRINTVTARHIQRGRSATIFKLRGAADSSQQVAGRHRSCCRNGCTAQPATCSFLLELLQWRWLCAINCIREVTPEGKVKWACIRRSRGVLTICYQGRTHGGLPGYSSPPPQNHQNRNLKNRFCGCYDIKSFT
jgi:hypothetical protein